MLATDGKKAQSSAKGPSETAVYSRGDDSGLWDDEYLIQLWNEQLELMNSKKAMRGDRGEAAAQCESPDSAEEGGEESSRASSTDDSAEEESESCSADEAVGCGRAFAALARAESSVESPTQRGARATAPAQVQCPLPVGHLPAEVQALVQSFYIAGFEAGKFTALHEDRKRTRD